MVFTCKHYRTVFLQTETRLCWSLLEFTELSFRWSVWSLISRLHSGSIIHARGSVLLDNKGKYSKNLYLFTFKCINMQWRRCWYKNYLVFHSCLICFAFDPFSSILILLWLTVPNLFFFSNTIGTLRLDLIIYILKEHFVCSLFYLVEF